MGVRFLGGSTIPAVATGSDWATRADVERVRTQKRARGAAARTGWARRRGAFVHRGWSPRQPAARKRLPEHPEPARSGAIHANRRKSADAARPALDDCRG